LRNHGNDEVRHVAFVGLHLEPLSRQDDQRPTGISWRRRSKDILFEDLYVGAFSNNINLQALSDAAPIHDVRINGCVIVDSWSLGSHSQGIYVQGLQGLTIENSVVASNGFNLERGAQPTIFNHNIYIQNGATAVVVRNNIIADASSHGLQLRPGGVAEGNLFLSNPLAIMFGGGTNPDEGGVTGNISSNIILHGRSITESLPRSFGIEVSNARDVIVDKNILSVSEVGHNGSPIDIAAKGDYGVTGLRVANNFIVGWHGGINVAAPGATHAFEGNLISSNYLYRDLLANNGNHNFNKSFVSTFSSENSGVSFGRNVYKYHGMHNRPFRVAGQNFSLDAWKHVVESDAIFEAASTPPPYLTIDSYLQTIGHNGSVAYFLQLARKRSRVTSQDDDISSSHVYSWVVDKIDSIR
jgi:hypothetical protein